jgi:hypothetical protein
MANWALLSAISYGLIDGGLSSSGVSGSRRLLVVTTLAVLIRYFVYAINRKHISLSRSSRTLILLYIYFLFSVIFDTGEIELVILYSVSPTGGLLFFYLIGIASSACMSAIIERKINSTSQQGIDISILAFMIASLTIALLLFKDNSVGLSEGVFAMIKGRDDYQKIGDYLSVFFILISSIFFYGWNIHVFGLNKKSRFIYITTIIVYFCISFLLMLITQMFGSNSGPMVIFAVSIYTILMLKVQTDLGMKNSGIGSKSFLILDEKRLFVNYALKSLPLIGALLLIMYFIAVHVFDLDISTFRIFNYGQSDDLVTNSIVARIDVLDYYAQQFSYNPIFGNMIVDKLTTGDGTYAHSLLLSLQSHLGIVGVGFFVLYLAYLVDENKIARLNEGTRLEIADNLYKKGLATLIIVLAIASAFFTWMPLWFVLGFCYGSDSLRSAVASSNRVGKHTNKNPTC